MLPEHRDRRRSEHRDRILADGQFLGRGAMPHLPGPGAQESGLLHHPAHQIQARYPRTEITAWRSQNAADGANLHHPAAVDDQHPVGEREDVEHIVGDQQNRARTPGEHPPQHRPGRRRTGDIEPGQRLVEDQHIRIGRQRPGQCHPLRLTAGDLGGPAVG